jgi:hypothetical protein
MVLLRVLATGISDMKKMIYTQTNGSVVVVTPAPKERIESVIGPLTDAQYEAHVISRSIPNDAINLRSISDEDIPTSREFRDAWVDVTEESRIDICCEKVKEKALTDMRQVRDKKLLSNDMKYMLNLKNSNSPEITERGQLLVAETTEELLLERDQLLAATDGLKQLDVVGKVNDSSILYQIDLLSKPEILK